MSASCSHLNDYLVEKGTDSYSLIHSFFISCIAKGARQRRAHDCYCNICGGCSGAERIHACLDCAFFGCYPEHIRQHYEETQHAFAAEILHGAVYCFHCSDYQYHSELIAIGKKNKTIEAKIYGTQIFSPWQPTSEELKLVEKMTGGTKKLKAHTFTGLRGIHNFGNTCYISCILQVFVHTPLLVDYFLGDKHACKLSSVNCMVCEMISVYQKFYSGRRNELVLEKLLFLVFKTAKQFSNNEQHDAQEFFLKFIDVLCMHNRGIAEPGESILRQHCECIFHKTFSSLIWEDTLCGTCSTLQNVRMEESPLCLSLDFRTEGGYIDAGEQKTVEDCLRKYTSKQLSGVQKFCENCQEVTDTCNQRTIRRLPIVVSLHLQRLSHISEICGDKVNYTLKKNFEFVAFQDSLDFSPFVCESRKNHPQSSCNILSEYDKRFSLYAVVCHNGNADNGHYVSYVKLNDNEWYICDDHKIRHVHPKEVFSAGGYILFYHKKILEYDMDNL